MLHTVTFRALAIAACGWLLACDASALTLGRARGAILIGRPLEITVPVTLDRQETEVPCASADVFYGEQKAAPPTVRWEPTGGTQGNLRIISSGAVDEPMVTVYVRVGCAQSSTRRFVLLSEVPPDNESALPILRSAPVTAPSRQAPAGTEAAPAATAARPPRRPVQRVPEATEAPVASKARRPERALPPQATLRLEPLDLSIDRSPTLRLTSELGTQVATDPRNREAAAAMWAALQKGPEEALQDVVRLQGVERELKSLRETTRQNAAAAAEMRGQVEQARGERNFVSLAVIVLAVLLAALLGWLAWRWHRADRVARVGRWFEANGKTVPQVVPAPASAAAVAAAEAAAEAAAIPSPSAWSPSDFQASRSGSVRMVGVDELIDVHDKADFFLSIGETDQAVAVLEAHVHDQIETSALAWMDLLELYHSLGKRADFERLRSEFSERFTAQVPDFEHFDQPSASLENYSRALSRIVALWPSRRVLDVIEESIFRRPGLPGAEPFSLEAYRELVLLYHVAREVAPPEQQRGGEGRSANFSDTSLQPLNMLETQQLEHESDQDLLMIPPASSRLGVDIDLTAEEADAEGTGDELPPLDFDMSEFDDLPADAGPKRN